jgi:hypothetical protein
MERPLQHILRSFAAAAAFAICASTLPAAANADMPSGETVDGIKCDKAEGVAFHIHQHLSLIDHGKPVTIPADIGRPVLTQCFYWLHTHTPDGLIHVESPTVRTFTLGQFFAVWGQPLSTKRAGPLRAAPGTTLHVFVGGEPYTGDPRKIELAQHTDIVIESGPPFSKPAPFTDWGVL